MGDHGGKKKKILAVRRKRHVRQDFLSGAIEGKRRRKKPRYQVVAVTGMNIKVYGIHLRKRELEQIAESVGAELVLLKQGEKEKK